MDLDRPEVPPGVGELIVGHALPGQAGATGPERHRPPRLLQQRGDLRDVRRDDDTPWHQGEVRGVMGVGETVQMPLGDSHGGYRPAI
nr:hypothetical protein Ade03nite_85950 [Actinoplanes derwentensis]